MTEAEWNACTEPQKMLRYFAEKVSVRKLRLFAVACIRRNCRPRVDGIKPVIEVGERYADEIASELERQRSWNLLRDVGASGTRSPFGAEEALAVEMAYVAIAPAGSLVSTIEQAQPLLLLGGAEMGCRTCSPPLRERQPVPPCPLQRCLGQRSRGATRRRHL